MMVNSIISILLIPFELVHMLFQIENHLVLEDEEEEEVGMKVLLEDWQKALGVEWKMQVQKAGAEEDLVPSLVEKVWSAQCKCIPNFVLLLLKVYDIPKFQPEALHFHVRYFIHAFISSNT